MRKVIPSLASALVGAAIVLNLVACSSAKVERQYDRELSFADFKTFEILPSKSIANPDLRSLLESLITTELTRKGLREVEGGAHLLVTYDGWVGNREQIATRLGYAVETYNGVTTVYTVGRGVEVGVLVLVLVERSTGHIAWKASAQAGLKQDANAKKRLKRLEGVLSKMLATYPPKT